MGEKRREIAVLSPLMFGSACSVLVRGHKTLQCLLATGVATVERRQSLDGLRNSPIGDEASPVHVLDTRQ